MNSMPGKLKNPHAEPSVEVLVLQSSSQCIISCIFEYMYAWKVRTRYFSLSRNYVRFIKFHVTPPDHSSAFLTRVWVIRASTPDCYVPQVRPFRNFLSYKSSNEVQSECQLDVCCTSYRKCCSNWWIDSFLGYIRSAKSNQSTSAKLLIAA